MNVPHQAAREERRRKSEGGYLMAALAAAVAVMVIFATLAFQAWVDVLRRDNEAEMIFRAQDLVRAIQRYRRDHGGVAPQKLEDLMEPGGEGPHYYLRQLWKDPLVPDGKWGLVYVGPAGQLIDPNAVQQETGLDGGLGLGGGLGRGGSIFDRNQGEEEQDGPGGSASQSGGPLGQPGRQQQYRTLSSKDENADQSAGGKQIAGLPIAGVRTLCEEDPFRVYNGLTEYREWLFTYLDLEQAQVPGRGRQPGGRPGRNPGQPGFGQPRGNQGQPGAGQRGGQPNRGGPGRDRRIGDR